MKQSQDELNRLERSRNATFTLQGVVAARTPEAAQHTHDSLQKICSTIIDAYKVANSAQKTRAQKKAAIREMTTLVPDLEWLVKFTHDESNHCSYPEIHQKMFHISQVIKNQVNILKQDLQTLEEQIEKFTDVFDVMLSVLEQMTEFLKQAHATEVCRVIDMGKNAYAETNNMLNLEIKGNLVPQTKIVQDRCKEFWTATHQLIIVQEDTNAALVSRIENVDFLLKKSIPELVFKTKEVLLNPGGGTVKEFQKQAYQDVISCLDEINKLLDRLKVKFTTEFDEDAVRTKQEMNPVKAATKELTKELAKMRSAPDESEEKHQSSARVPELTKNVLSEMTKAQLGDEPKRAFVEAVKQARDGDIPSYFSAIDDMVDLVDKLNLQQQQPLQLAPISVVKAEPMDMLEAAKAMCAALKGLNLVLDD